MQSRQKQGVVQTSDLAKAIYELIEEFGLVRGNPRTGIAHKIVRTIFNTIKEALQRGESVRIVGLGTFSVYTRKPYSIYVTYWAKTGYVRILKNLPSKQIVRFTPNKPIIKDLNHES